MKSKTMLKLAAACAFIPFASADRAARAQSDTPKFELGAQYSLLTFDTHALTDRRRNESGFGGRFTYNFSKYIAAEGQIDFFPRQDLDRIGTIDVLLFGRKALGVFGIKAGARGKRMAVFGKARPGFMRYSAVEGVLCLQVFPNPCPQPGKTNFAFDVGGVFEYYPSRRAVVRFDAGDTIIHHKILFGTTHNFQFSAGVGVRF